MQINHNISAVIANNQLRKSEDRMTKSVQRLSSGLKINCAADDPSGMAISQKMKTQIRGLNRANDNANDGISVLQTAEGGLTEIHSMLQRMRELAVQSANGIYTTEDRQAIQNEIDSLCEEVNRISTDTQFNKVSLLDGSIDKRGYSNMDGVSVITFSNVVEPDEYTMRVAELAKKAQASCTLNFNEVTEEMVGSLSINGNSVPIELGDTVDDVYMKMRDVAETIGVKVTKTGTNVNFESFEYGSDQAIKFQWDNPTFGNSLDFSSTAAEDNINITTTSFEAIGEDTQLTLTGNLRNAVYTADGTKAIITDAGGFQIEIDVDPTQATINQNVNLDIMDIGAMVLQIGSNEGQTMDLKIPAINTYTLNLDYLNMLSQTTSEIAISDLDAAIERVSSVRSAIGAYQNRLEHTISNLGTSELNLENALSRIEDVDMAEEMTEYTASSVLEQAGTSVLAQANELPKTVLQLLG